MSVDERGRLIWKAFFLIIGFSLIVMMVRTPYELKSIAYSISSGIMLYIGWKT